MVAVASLDSFLDLYEFLATPISLGRMFRRPRQLALVLVVGIVLEGIAESRRHAVVVAAGQRREGREFAPRPRYVTAEP
jgi:hypothetical protein